MRSDGAGVGASQLQGFSRTVRAQHGIALAFEEPDEHGADLGDVLDDQHDLTCHRARAGPGAGRGLIRRFDGLDHIRGGDQDFEGRALTVGALDVDQTTSLLDHAIDRGQAQAGAFGLCREERVEEVREPLRRDTDAGVANHELDVRTRFDAQPEGRPRLEHLHDGRRDAQGATLRHGILGVERQVENDLLDLAAVDQHQRQLGRQLES